MCPLSFNTYEFMGFAIKIFLIIWIIYVPIIITARLEKIIEILGEKGQNEVAKTRPDPDQERFGGV